MEAIMISIQPQWVEKILNGEKTIEIRKTKPSCELPCKVYIYMTKKRNFFMANRKGEEIWFGDGLRYGKTEIIKFPKCDVQYWHLLGKVVAEFTLNKIETLWQNNKNKTSTATVVDKAIFEKQTCMTWKQYCEYHKCKNGKYPNSYAWHIDDLKIYDTPKELSEFSTSSYCSNYMRNVEVTVNVLGDYVAHYEDNFLCKKCKYFDGDFNICNKKIKTKTRPPQSWCYVEELENE